MEEKEKSKSSTTKNNITILDKTSTKEISNLNNVLQEKIINTNSQSRTNNNEINELNIPKKLEINRKQIINNHNLL